MRRSEFVRACAILYRRSARSRRALFLTLLVVAAVACERGSGQDKTTTDRSTSSLSAAPRAQAKGGALDFKARKDRLRKLIHIADLVLAEPYPPVLPRGEMMQWHEQLRGSLDTIADMSQLRELESMFLTYWNEATGPETEVFWKRVAEAGIDLQRRDVIAEVLARGRILDRQEYDIVTDNIGMLLDQGKTREANRLSTMLGDYEDAQLQ